MRGLGRNVDAGRIWAGLIALVLTIFISPQMHAQSSALSGAITDPSGRAIPKAKLVLTNLDTNVKAETVTSSQGNYSFPNISTGKYSLHAEATGFSPSEQTGFTIALNQQARIDVKLEVGASKETIVVTDITDVNRENATLQTDISPTTLIQLPVVTSGGARSAADFVQLMPGVASSGAKDTVWSPVNGGLNGDGDSLVDGISTQEGSMSQSGLVSLGDSKLTPDMVSELNVVTANYEPQYGNALGVQILEDFRSGTSQFHGSAFEYARNTAFNAAQWTGKATPAGFTKPEDNQHDYGVRVGGPIPIPILSSGRSKTFFFGLYEGYAVVGGSPSKPQLQIPTLRERAGDFTDWLDAKGNLIPVYDPGTTTIVNGVVDRKQFMGCNGNQPNVICATDPRLVNSYAQSFIKYLPQPTYPNALPGVTNYLAPISVPPVTGQNTHYILGKIDNYLGEKDHFSFAVYHQVSPAKPYPTLPVQIDSNTYRADQHGWILRALWDHTFSPNLLNHFGWGFQNENSAQGCNDWTYAKDFPTIPGTFDPTTQVPQIDTNFATMGCSSGKPASPADRPARIFNDMVTLVKGKHTLKIGGEYRWLGLDISETGNQAGTFNFAQGETGVSSDSNSGSPWASFLLGQVDNSSFNYYTDPLSQPRQFYWTAYAGDTWKVTRSLTFNYGLRYDLDTPSWEVHDNSSFFDITGSNPGANNLAGREAWAGHKWGGDASYGARFPEQQFWKEFSPRIGIAYSVNAKTVVRTGYGIFFNQMYYDGWGAGVAIDGLNSTETAGSTQGGHIAAFNITDGVPKNYQTPPYVVSTLSNGHNIPNFRAVGGNNQGYTQQWNLTIERQEFRDVNFGASYVGNKGTHLHSQIDAINALNPSTLSDPAFGTNPLAVYTALESPFVSGQTNYGVAEPYPGWVASQNAGSCKTPTVAHAMLKYPQYCNHTQSVDENEGASTYHSLQLKMDKRFSNGLYFLANYTWEKAIGNTSYVDESEAAWNAGGLGDSISPYEKKRNKSIMSTNIPQVFHAAAVYDLPVGRGRLLNIGNRALDSVVGGWQTSAIVRMNSGTPLFFRSSACKVPGELALACIPSQLPGVNPWLQDHNHFDINKPVLNQAAFEPATAFNTGTHYGNGPRVSNLNAGNYRNLDAAILKTFPIYKERVSFKLRADLFNAFNNHYFAADNLLGQEVLNTNVAAGNFGYWTGAVSSPRVMQVSGRIEF